MSATPTSIELALTLTMLISVITETFTPFLKALKCTKELEYKIHYGSTRVGTVKWDKSSSFYYNLTPIPDTVRVRNSDKYGNIYYVISNNWVNLSRIFPSDGKHIMDNYYLIFCIE
jgi:hypothetical protein